MEASHRLPSGENITIHYQYNSVTGKAYDMKITTPQPLSPALQPGKTLEQCEMIIKELGREALVQVYGVYWVNNEGSF